MGHGKVWWDLRGTPLHGKDGEIRIALDGLEEDVQTVFYNCHCLIYNKSVGSRNFTDMMLDQLALELGLSGVVVVKVQIVVNPFDACLVSALLLIRERDCMSHIQ